MLKENGIQELCGGEDHQTNSLKDMQVKWEKRFPKHRRESPNLGKHTNRFDLCFLTLGRLLNLFKPQLLLWGKEKHNVFIINVNLK